METGKSTEPMPEVRFAPDGPRDALLEEQLRQDNDLPRYLDAAIESRLRGDPPVTVEDLKKKMRARNAPLPDRDAN